MKKITTQLLNNSFYDGNIFKKYEFRQLLEWGVINSTSIGAYNETEQWSNISKSNDSWLYDQWPDDSWSNERIYYYPSGYSRTKIILMAFFLTAIIMVIVVGNLLVCIAIGMEKSLRKAQNFFIASLAVSDFLLGLTVMPFSLAKEIMGYWMFGELLCDLNTFLDILFCTVSVNSLCIISLDRYWSITKPIKYIRKRTKRRSIYMICGVWILSILISLPPLIGWKSPKNFSDYPQCFLTLDIGYVLYSSFGSFYIPASIIIFAYCRIFIETHRHLKQREKSYIEFSAAFDPAKSTITTSTKNVNISTTKNTDSTSTPIKMAPEIYKDGTNSSTNPNDSGRSMEIFHVESSHISRLSKQPHRIFFLNNSKLLKSLSRKKPYLDELCNSNDEMIVRGKDKDNKIKDMKKEKFQQGSFSASCRSQTSIRQSDFQRLHAVHVKEFRAALMLGLIMVSFILTWLPFFVLYNLRALCTLSCSINKTGFTIAFWLAYCNSAVNPIIYTIFNKDFREAFRKIFFRLFISLRKAK